MILCARDIAQGSVVSCALVFLSRPETRDRSSFVETLSLLIEFGTTMDFFYVRPDCDTATPQS